ncbi:MAG: ABC transporter ATP-binding protein [Geobacteraceae bacterium GWC2_55_20]|nr:MAG: ABC transporter ATP-binding protein [Geobacteraceae bacterium GWC2_55_20]OGU21065.1 MAG: ABC transporter ATP-binding protein [Geobacteraceae bacterium GWF2_54_21]OHB25200.1 MAG: ABC transporter ATP-binding protein [Desulfuromonadaceae bacterium GWB2_53_15]HCE67151.1 ABC transporter ATP-binding protein [Geobacter sp.]
MLQLHDVTKTFAGKSEVTALAGINLNIGAGEMVAIMGPSGSGKSTLLNLLGGLDVPTSGQIVVAGKNLAGESEKERSLFRRSQVSYIFQAYHLMPTLKVSQNVALPLHLAGIPAGEIARKVERVLKEVGLEARENHLPDELSGGERQRVAIARALVTDAPLLLADEPTGNLDTARGEEILNLLRTIHRERGTTIVIVTHDHHAASACDRLIKLRDGRVEGDSAVGGGK